MRLLLIEDNIDFATEVERAVNRIPDCDEIVLMRSRDSAQSALDSESFDLIILDRKLPSADDTLDGHVDHGWGVFEFIRSHTEGTPVWFLTGTEDPDFAGELNNEYGRSEDLHGQGIAEPLYQVFWKKRISDCLRKLTTFAAERKALERIAMQVEPPTLRLNIEESRTIRLFGRRYHGATVAVSSLNGGLSNSRVLKIVVKAADGRVLTTAAAKVSSLSETKEEARRYQAQIVRLKPGGFPQLTTAIRAGAGKIGGLFYGMVGQDVKSLFDRMAESDPSVATIPSVLRDILGPWYQAKQTETVRIAQIRRQFLPDSLFYAKQIELKAQRIDVTAIESREIVASVCCQHRDLHCANVVFDESGRLMLIDFGDADTSFSAVDPITLELSTIFHSQHVRLPKGWPTEENLMEWSNVDRFTANCQISTFIVACREWADAEAGSKEEVIAIAYAYAMRQLKYPDTDKKLAIALIKGCISFFQTTGHPPK